MIWQNLVTPTTRLVSCRSACSSGPVGLTSLLRRGVYDLLLDSHDLARCQLTCVVMWPLSDFLYMSLGWLWSCTTWRVFGQAVLYQCLCQFLLFRVRHVLSFSDCFQYWLGDCNNIHARFIRTTTCFLQTAASSPSGGPSVALLLLGPFLRRLRCGGQPTRFASGVLS